MRWFCHSVEVGWFFGIVRFFLGGCRAVRGFFLMGGDFKSLCARGICVRPVCPFPYGHDSEHSHSIQTILLVFKFGPSWQKMLTKTMCMGGFVLGTSQPSLKSDSKKRPNLLVFFPTICIRIPLKINDFLPLDHKTSPFGQRCVWVGHFGTY